VCIAFFAAACWGTVVVLNKKVLEYVRPLPVNFLVLTTCTVCLVAVAVPLSLLDLWPLGFTITWRAAAWIAGGSAITWLVAFNAFYYALRSGRAGVVGPITGTDPLFTALFAVLIVGAALGGLTVAGLVIATCGVVLISRWMGSEPEPHAPVLEGTPDAPPLRESAATVVTLSLVTAAGWGFGPVMIQMAEEAAGGASTTMILMGEALGVALLTPFMLRRRTSLFTRTLEPHERRRVLWLIIAAGALNALFAVLFYVLIEQIGAVLTAVVVATSPLFTIAGSALFLDERFSRRLILGAVVTFAGVLLAVVDGAV